jgi:hypothetical protein
MQAGVRLEEAARGEPLGLRIVRRSRAEQMDASPRGRGGRQSATLRRRCEAALGALHDRRVLHRVGSASWPDPITSDSARRLRLRAGDRSLTSADQESLIRAARGESMRILRPRRRSVTRSGPHDLCRRAAVRRCESTAAGGSGSLSQELRIGIPCSRTNSLTQTRCVEPTSLSVRAFPRPNHERQSIRVSGTRNATALPYYIERSDHPAVTLSGGRPEVQNGWAT